MEKEAKIKNKIHGLAVAHLWLILGVILLPLISPTTTAEPPYSETKECIAYGYTESNRHFFLINENSLVFGTNVTFEHNCESLQLNINNNISAFDQTGKFTIILEVGFQNLTITNNENYTRNYSNVQVLPDRLTWEFEYYEWEGRNDFGVDELISLTSSEARENWASILSIVVVFSLVTMVYWHLINSYIDRNYCEEVKK
ncbi:MAG: hypothetical protein CMC21_02085 [Flavobacteriaceae bacterium]|nr:hypothetical protein [Flavobacteriaceae bacterium]|tara:strand:+ start:46 stop:645 length:600 start_codon:yes stop_codon:yes gene_type:complete